MKYNFKKVKVVIRNNYLNLCIPPAIFQNKKIVITKMVKLTINMNRSKVRKTFSEILK